MFRRILYTLRRGRNAGELHEEIRLHVELRARRLEEQGIPADEARYRAQRQFGNAALVEDRSRETWGFASCERFAQDFRQAARSLRKTPGFTAIAILTLALGLGMNTAVFTLVDAVILRALPYREPAQLVSLWEDVSRGKPNDMSSHGWQGGHAARIGRTTVSLPNLADYRNSGAFTALAAYDLAAKNLTSDGNPERIFGEIVNWQFLSILGVSPAIGRDFLPQDDRFGASPVVILSYDFWQQRMGGDPQALGRSLTLDGSPRRIIGILPASFRSPAQLTVPDHVVFYVPAAFSPSALASRGDHDVNVVGRLRPGVSLAAAQAELKLVSARVDKQFPQTNRNLSAQIAPLAEDLVSGVSESLWVLLGAAGLIVLIACVNVANLLLVRSAGRRHETSVRFALGASRLRIVRQFLAESLLLALSGCLAGILLGRLLLQALLALAPADIPRISAVSMDWTVFAVAAAIASLTGLVFGLAPAWQASQTKASEALKTAARNKSGRSQVRWRAVLTASEVGLSLVLLVGAGLLLKSFVLLMGVDIGFQPERVLAMTLTMLPPRYPGNEARLRLFDQLEQRVRALPGVQAVAYANRLPLRGGWSGSMETDLDPKRDTDVDYQAVSTGYFETLGIPLVRGQGITADDRMGAPNVALVNQTFVREFFRQSDPLGHHIRHGDDAPWVTVVGVVNDIRRGGKDKQINPQVYLPAAQTDLYPVVLQDFAVRTAGNPRQLAKAVQAQVWSLDRELPVTSVSTLEELVTAGAARRRFQTILLLTFAGVALALAVIGVFGVLSYSVSQRTGELGIRLALGARPASILALVLKQAGALVGAGVALGLVAAFALTRYLQSLLFGIQRTDWTAYAAAVLLLAAISLIAAMVPARRGARLDPMAALREE